MFLQSFSSKSSRSGSSFRNNRVKRLSATTIASRVSTGNNYNIENYYQNSQNFRKLKRTCLAQHVLQIIVWYSLLEHYKVQILGQGLGLWVTTVVTETEYCWRSMVSCHCESFNSINSLSSHVLANSVHGDVFDEDSDVHSTSWKYFEYLNLAVLIIGLLLCGVITGAM